jgi:peptide/nickel transport system permease protein
MRRYIVKRILHGLFVMWLVATVLFFGLRALPGGPVRTMLGQDATPETVNRMRNELGLNDPLPVQYVDWMTDLLVLNFGQDIVSREAVSTLLASAVPKTFSIGLVAIVVGLSLGLSTGIVSAVKRDHPVDYVSTVAAFLGLSVPAFFIGIVLAVVFAVQLGLLPTFGYAPLSEGFVPWLEHLVLPGVAVGLPYAAVIMRITRSSLLEVEGEMYMQTAHAKGVNDRTRLYKHALPNALLPVITIAGIQVAIVLVGSVTVELVFGIRGLGRLLVNSILSRNYPITQGTILVVAAVMVTINLLVDVVYTFIDPRIRYGGEGQR